MAEIIELKDHLKGKGKHPEPPRSGAELVRGLKEAYTLFSPLTNLPYAECEQENFNDQSFLYETKEAVEAAAAAYEEQGVRVSVRELKTVELQIPVQADKPDGEKRRVYLNQVRQHLGILPFMGLNAVRFQPAAGAACLIDLEELLPEDFQKKVNANELYQPTLQLTGAYLMQEARRKKEFVDMKHLKELDEEFSSNLVKSRLFLAVLPPEGKEKEPKLNLSECKLPYLKHQNGDLFFPVFTDIWEFQKYAQSRKGVRSIQIPFTQLLKFEGKEAKSYMLNPMGFSLPLTREMIPKLLQKFGASVEPT
ncbi:MAG: SseB family protein [Eubacteriales bacterium]|nr:SseB family protein [Eubacteriales bacterium]